MKFTKTFLKDLAREDHDEDVVQLISEEEGESRRWVVAIHQVFKFEGKLYMTTYDRGLTECQETTPYEFGPDEIDCPEVRAVECTVIEYVPV